MVKSFIHIFFEFEPGNQEILDASQTPAGKVLKKAAKSLCHHILLLLEISLLHRQADLCIRLKTGQSMGSPELPDQCHLVKASERTKLKNHIKSNL